MKMKKRILAAAMATVLIVGSAVGVMAEGSRSKNVTLSGEDSGKYVLTQAIEATEAYKTLKTEEPETAVLIDEVNAGTKTMKAFAEELTAMADETTDETSKAALEEVVKAVESRDFVTGFFDLVPEGDVEKNENGKYEVTLSVPALTENTTDVAVLHYSTARKIWEVIEPKNVDKENKTVTAEFEDFSPVAVIAKEGTFDTLTSGEAQGTSPKTEGVSNWMLWAGAAVLFLITGSVLLLKRKDCR